MISKNVNEPARSVSRLSFLILSALFAALTAIGAHLKIPLPLGIPITLQTTIVLLAGFLLGARYGALSQVLYLVIGLIGFPVFAEGGGPAYVLKPTFGYLLGFPLAAYVAGWLAHGRHSPPRPAYVRAHLRSISTPRVFLAGASGLLAIFIPGLVYFFIASTYFLNLNLHPGKLFVSGFLVFLPGDVVKLTVIALFLRLAGRTG